MKELLKEIIEYVDRDEINNFKAMKIIEENPNLDFSSINKSIKSILLYCVREKKIEFVKYLLSLKNIDLEIKNANNITPLLESVIHNNKEMFNLLIEHKNPGLTIRNNGKLTAMELACSSGKIDMVKKIAEHPQNNMLNYERAHFYMAVIATKTKVAEYLMSRDDFMNDKQWLTPQEVKMVFSYMPAKFIKEYVKKIEQFNFGVGRCKTNNKIQEPLWWSLISGSNEEYLNKKFKLIKEAKTFNLNDTNENGETFLATRGLDDIYPAVDILINEKNLNLFVKNKYDTWALNSGKYLKEDSNAYGRYARRLKKISENLKKWKSENTDLFYEKIIEIKKESNLPIFNELLIEYNYNKLKNIMPHEGGIEKKNKNKI